jgi:hypothetical protein
MTTSSRIVTTPGREGQGTASRGRHRHGGSARFALLCAGLCAGLVMPRLAEPQAGTPAGSRTQITTPVQAPAAPVQPAAGVAVAPAPPEEPAGAADAATDFQSLDAETQTLRKDVLDLNRELFLLEEELLFPTSTQVAVYVSYDVGTFFALDAVKILVDDKEVASYLYTAREVDALQRGGVHRVWLGNLKVGRHVVTAFFNGKGPHDRDYRTGATLEVEKGVGAKYLELKISDRQQKLQPEFIVKQWD